MSKQVQMEAMPLGTTISQTICCIYSLSLGISSYLFTNMLFYLLNDMLTNRWTIKLFKYSSNLQILKPNSNLKQYIYTESCSLLPFISSMDSANPLVLGSSMCLYSGYPFFLAISWQILCLSGVHLVPSGNSNNWR